MCSVLYAPYPVQRISLESYVCNTDICVVCSRIDKFIDGSHNSYTSFDFVGEFLSSSYDRKQKGGGGYCL